MIKFLKAVWFWLTQEPHFICDMGTVNLLIFCPKYNYVYSVKVGCLDYQRTLCPRCGAQLKEPFYKGQWVKSYAIFSRKD